MAGGHRNTNFQLVLVTLLYFILISYRVMKETKSQKIDVFLLMFVQNLFKSFCNEKI